MEEKNMADIYLRNQVIDLLKNILSHNIKLPQEQISEDSSFEEYGIDSIAAVKMVDTLEIKFGSLSKTLFFEYHTIRDLAEYFMNEQHEKVENLFSCNLTRNSIKSTSSDYEKAVAQNHVTQRNDKKVYRKLIADKIMEILSQDIKMPVSSISTDTSFEEYGVDSNLALKMTEKLERIFGSLSKTLFFEYHSIDELADYFAEERYSEAVRYFSGQISDSDKPHINAVENGPAEKNAHVVSRKLVPNVTGKANAEKESDSITQKDETHDIAIIGLALKCPKADNLVEFWENLCEGKDCITKIPKERFDVDEYYNPDKNESGNIYSKWGGFISGVDEFDPMFFNISPKEAATLEPQDRLFLQCAHAAIEDAGYTKDNLAGKTRDVGVFVGAIYEEYQLYAAQEQQKGNPIAVESSMASIANRVSFYCNFNGPSMSLDTMCSSSLTAIHLACNSLKLGECSVAIAGGVNLSIHPNKYLSLSSGKFLSTNGRCTSFGQGGDGFVPSEAVGALILKPFEKAKDDGDHIYGIIKGTSINHGGKTNGFTVPNPNAQTDVIKKALKQAGVDARAISYIEAHGTGTSLGDPIEIKGLTKAFRNYTKDNQFCYIGSVKSNIGHCESAAGIASVAKVLLQMKYKQLVPSIHSEILNPYIEFEKTPFIVSRELREWKRPVFMKDGKKKEYPRIAGVSGFGAGGSNAYLIIQEYQEEKQRELLNQSLKYVILLSARRKEQLDEYIKEINAYLKRYEFSDSDLPSIAYCLQTGREAMDYRLGFTVSTTKELKEKFLMIANHEKVPGVYIGNKVESLELISLLQQFSSFAQEELFKTEQYDKLINIWTKGINIDWSKLYVNSKTPLKISFPTYPFAKEKYWYTDIKVKKRNMPSHKTSVAGNSKAEKTSQKTVPTKYGKELEKIKNEINNDIKSIINDILEIPVDLIDINKSFESLGFNSISLVEFSVILNEKFNINVTPDIFYSYSTIKTLNDYLLKKFRDNIMQSYDVQQVTHRTESAESTEIEGNSSGYGLGSDNGKSEKGIQVAIVGISGRFPGAANTEEFWNILKEGRETIGRMPQNRTEWGKIYDSSEEEKISRRKLGALSKIAEFDPAFFEISPREAINMDPNQRLLLEEMWKALEDAGYSDKTMEENMGVYVGAEESDYHELTTDVSLTANHNAVLAARLAYFLNLKGANMTINTACSSGLVAFHQAVLTIRSGESDAAVVGGVNILAKPDKYLAMEGANMLSKDGKCYAFDRRASGMVPAEAVAVVVLKRLDKAIRDGNHIYAKVLGSGVNYDGRTNGITAPSGISQANLIETVYKRFHINPEEVSYIVTHGTGTKLGDPIECNALDRVFKKYTDKRAYCALSSNKPNIGHSLAASGLVSLISLVLAMKHETIPASINSGEENDYISWKESPFYINHKNQDWKDRDGKTRIGAVSAFGMSGTNAHVVLKSFHAQKTQIKKVPEHLLVFSAKSEEVLTKLIREYREYFESRKFIANEELTSISYTLTKGRSHFNYRCAVTAGDYYEATEMLKKAELRIEDAYVVFGKVKKNFQESDEVLGEIKLLKDNLLKADIPVSKYKDIIKRLSVFYVNGYEDIWSGTNPGFISLPTYPFSEKSYWPKPKTEQLAQGSMQKPKPAVEKAVRKSVLTGDKPIQIRDRARVQLDLTENFANISHSDKMHKNPDKIHLKSLTKESEIHTGEYTKIKKTVNMNELVPRLVQSLADELYCEKDEIDLESSFVELGLDSIIGVEWVSRLNKKYGLNIRTTKLYQYSNVLEFAQYVKDEIESAPSFKGTKVETEAGKRSGLERKSPLVDGQAVMKELVRILADELYIDSNEINLAESFTEMGLDSIVGVGFISKINKKFSLNVKTTQLYNFGTAMEFMKYIIEQIASGQAKKVSAEDTKRKGKICYKDNSEAKKNLILDLVRSFAKELYMDESEVDLTSSFMEMGLDSIIGVEWIGKINKKYDLHINTTKLYQYPNILELAGYISSELGIERAETEEIKTMQPEEKHAASSIDSVRENTFKALLNQIYNGDIDVDDALNKINEY